MDLVEGVDDLGFVVVWEMAGQEVVEEMVEVLVEVWLVKVLVWE